MVLKKIKMVYLITLILLVVTNIIVLTINKLNLVSFYYFSSSLFIIFPFVSLFFILFTNLKKVDYEARKYDETSLITFIIIGSLWLYLYSKIEIQIMLNLAFIISISIFAIILIIFIFLNYRYGKISDKPKIIRNK